MDETKYQDQTAKHKFTRADFLKSSVPLAAGLAYGLDKAAKAFFSTDTIPESEKFSKLNVDFRLGMHAILPRDLDKNTVLIGGETFERMLFRYYGMTPPPLTNDLTYEITALNKDQHRSTTVSKKIAEDQNLALLSAQEQGVHIISADNRHFQSVGFERIADSYNLASEKQLTIAKSLGLSAVTMMGEMVREIINIRRGGGFTEGNPLLSFSIKLSQAFEKPDKVPLVKDILKSFIGFEFGKYIATPGESMRESISDIGNLQKVLVSFSDKQLAGLFDLIEIRSASMALGFYAGQKMLDKLGGEDTMITHYTEEGKEPRAVYFAGSAHANTENFYKSGPDACKREIIKKVNGTIENGLELMESVLSGDNKEVSEEVAKIYWILSTSGFSYALGDYMKSDKYVNVPVKDAIPSARGILWANLYDRFKKDPTNKALNILVKSLAKEDIEYMNMLEPLLPQIRSKASDEKKCQIVKNLKLDDGSNFSLNFVDGMPVIFDKKI